MPRGAGTEKFFKKSKERNMVNTAVVAFQYLFSFQKSNWIHSTGKKLWTQ